MESRIEMTRKTPRPPPRTSPGSRTTVRQVWRKVGVQRVPYIESDRDQQQQRTMSVAKDGFRQGDV
jgi:hypothetical protein